MTTPFAVDYSQLVALANKNGAKVVDWDMKGTPITSCTVLMWGAYGPAVRRLLDLVAQEHGHVATLERVQELAPGAYGAAVDRDFGGNVMTDYSIILKAPHGFRDSLMRLVAELPNALVAQPL